MTPEQMHARIAELEAELAAKVEAYEREKAEDKKDAAFKIAVEALFRIEHLRSDYPAKVMRLIAAEAQQSAWNALEK